MKKRLLSTFLVFCMALTWVPSTAFAMELESELSQTRNDDEVTLDDADSLDTEINVTPYSDSERVAYPVTGGNIYFDPSTGSIVDCDTNVTEAEIPYEIGGIAVTSIGDSAFGTNYPLTNSLVKISIPNSVTRIGNYAFAQCTSLSELTIPEGVTHLGHNLIRGTAIKTITVPTTVTSSGSYYDDGAFANCTSLKEVIFAPGATKIPSHICASGDSGSTSYIERVVIPDSVQEIGWYAFYKCKYLSGTINIPSSVQKIGECAFAGCTAITSVITNYNSTPNWQGRIDDNAFGGCTSLSSVTLTGSYKSLGARLFQGCTSLSELTIPEGVTYLGHNLIRGTAIKTITVPTTVISSGSYYDDGAFANCTSLKEVIFAPGATKIPSHICASGDSGSTSYIERVVIPDSVQEIGWYAFYKCNALTDIYYSKDELQWKSVVIGTNNHPLNVATIHYDSTGSDIPSGDITMQVFPPPHVGGTTTMTATISNPGNLQQSDITWSSSNETVTTITPGTLTTNIYGTAVDATADIHCISEGTTTITITLADGRSASYKLQVTEKSPEEPKNEIQLSGNRSLLIGDFAALTAKIKLNVLDISDSIEWTSSNGDILAFNSNGESIVSRPISDIDIPTDSVITDSVTIYGRSPGKVRVTCKLTRSGVEKSFDVLVYSEESQALQDRSNDWITAFYNYVEAVVNLLGENKDKVQETTKEEQARALMRADQATNDRLVTFLSRDDEKDDKIALPVYMAVVDMLAEEAGNEFDLGNVDVSGADKDEYLTTVSIKIVKKVQNMINTRPYEYQYDNVFVTLSGISVGTTRERTISYAVNDPNNSKIVARLGSRQAELQATVEAYLKELVKLGNNAVNEAYAQMVKSVLNKSLNELIKAGVKDKLVGTNGVLTKHIDKFEKTGAGKVVTTISTCIDYYKYVDKIVKFADHDPAELLLDLSSMENLKFESTSIKDKTVKAAMKSLEEAKKALEKAIEEYADTGKIDWGAVAVGWAKDTFSGVTSVFKCPVNISVYDSTGKQVGYVGDDDLWYDDEIIYIEKYGDVKTIYSNNAALRFEVAGSNYGMLNCTFEEYSNGATVGRVNYYDIPLHNGSAISVEVADKAITNENVIVTVEGTDILTANEIIISSEYEDATINIMANVEQGGTVIGCGEYVRGDAVNLQAVAEDGYTFQGWKNNEGALVSISLVYEFTAKENLTLTASFAEYVDEDELSFYLVTFNATGGSVNPSSLVTEYDGKLKDLPIPTRDGYTFDGWCTSLEGGTQITLSKKFTEDTTVYAQWTKDGTSPEPDTYVITFDGVTTMTTNKDGKLSSLPLAPARNGYTFIGWYMANGTCVTTSTVFTENTAVYARWSKIDTSTTPGSGGGSSPDSDPTYSITVPSRVTGGSIKVSPTSASERQRVTITVKPNSGYELNTLTATDGQGNKLDLTSQGDGKYTFTMPKSKVNVKVEFVRQQTTPSFTDVQSGAYYADAVAWAVGKDITSGTSTTTFSPDASCTRAQTVTFLWRAAGSPAPQGGTNPFTDVRPGSYYYDAVLWAVEQGITSGTSATMFSPDATVTRGQTVTFLYRAAGSPAASGSTFFGDVVSGAYYANAVQWAVGKGVTAGTSATTFSPDSNCTRAQIVTFLYRDRAN